MSALEYAGLALFCVLIIATLAMSRRLYRGVLLWSWAWVIHILTGLALSAEGELVVVGPLLSLFFPMLQLAGTFDFLGRALPGWLVLTGISLIGASAGLLVLGMPEASAAIASLTEIPFLAACALLVLTQEEDTQSRRGLVVSFSALTLLELFDAGIELASGKPFFEWWLWVAVAVPVASFQIFVWFERWKRTLQDAEQDRLAMQEAEDRFSSLAHRSLDVIAEIDANANIVYVSPNALGTLGLAARDLIGKNLVDLVDWLEATPDMHDQPPAFDQPDLLLKNGPYGRNYRIRTPDGDDRWLEINSSNFETRTGETRSIAVVRDVTERRRFEAEMTRAQKLESLGMLAAGVAHDFNNLLASILNNAELAEADLEKDKVVEARRRLSSLQDAALQAKNLTGQLLTYAGKGDVQEQIIDVSEEIVRMSSLINAVVGDSLNIETELARGLQAVRIDVGQLQQIMLNLVTNAREACVNGGTILIETGPEECLPDDAIVPRASSGPYVCISVTDTGSGISPGTIAKIFDPFFTTKFDGRGIGLASVFGVLKMLGGAVSVHSVPGAGSVFRIYLPTTTEVADSSSETLANASGKERPASRAVLVIDDYDASRTLVSDALKDTGREVIAAEDGDIALAKLAEGALVGTIVMDFAMPGVSGSALVEQVRECVPEALIVVISGYSRTIVNEQLGDTAIDGFLQKPFRLAELYREIDRVESTRA